MLEYREIDYSKDIPGIVDLLRTSLSEKHTRESFKWKHIDNPFGKSLGFLALDKDKIIGVRMFMKWDFSNEGKIINAIRPVDTVTHPDFRNKGIFKKLTLDGLEKYKNNFDLIFNTPNHNSTPGNLKMGWQRFEKPLSLKIALLFPLKVPGLLNLVSLNSYNNKNYEQTYSLRTRLTKDFILWRYAEKIYKSAVYEYKNKQVFIIYRTTNIKNLKMVVLNEIIGDPQVHEKALKALMKKLGIYLLYYLNTDSVNVNPRIAVKKKGPLVLYRDDKTGFFNNMVFSLGDLEGRI
jgi:hypothetical protein